MIPDWAIIVGFAVLSVLSLVLLCCVLSLKASLYRTDRWVSDAFVKIAGVELQIKPVQEAVNNHSSSLAKLSPLMDHLGLKWVPASQSPGRIEKKATVDQYVVDSVSIKKLEKEPKR